MKKLFCLSLISLCGLASFFIPKTIQPVKAEETKPEDLSGYYELMDGPEQNYADRYNSEYILAYDDGTSMRVFHPNSYTNAYGENNFVTLNYSSRYIKKTDLTDTKSAFTIERYNAVDMFRVLYQSQNTKCLAMTDSPYNNDISIANGIYFISTSSSYEVLNKRAKITLEKPQYYPQRFVFGIGTLDNSYYEFRYNSSLNMIRPYVVSSSNFVNNPVRLYKLGGCNFAKTPSKIEITSAKTSFETGDSFVKPTVIAYYTDNSSEDVSSRATFTGFDSKDRSKMGTQTITASFTSNNVTVTTTYEIEMKGCKELSINLYDYKVANKLVYFIGEEFQRPSIEVICRIPSQNYVVPYDSVVEEPRSLTFSGFDSSKAGTVTVYVVYNGYNSDGSLTTSYTVTIKEPQPTSLEVTNHRDTYAQYEQFVPNITAICHYEDNSTLDVTNSVTVTAPGPFNTLGDYVIDVKFGNLVTSYTVHVVPAELVSIEVSNNAKTNYFVGDDFVAPKVFGAYNNGQVVEVDATFSGFSSDASGKYTITVTYDGKETSYVVTVKNPEVVSLAIGEYQNEYFVGDEFVAPVVTGHFDNGEEKEVEATFTGFDSSKVGEITVTASYNGVSITFKVEVKARPSAGGCGGSTSAPSITIFAFSLVSLGLLVLIKKRHAK